MAHSITAYESPVLSMTPEYGAESFEGGELRIYSVWDTGYLSNPSGDPRAIFDLQDAVDGYAIDIFKDFLDTVLTDYPDKLYAGQTLANGFVVPYDMELAKLEFEEGHPQMVKAGVMNADLPPSPMIPATRAHRAVYKAAWYTEEAAISHCDAVSLVDDHEDQITESGARIIYPKIPNDYVEETSIAVFSFYSACPYVEGGHVVRYYPGYSWSITFEGLLSPTILDSRACGKYEDWTVQSGVTCGLGYSGNMRGDGSDPYMVAIGDWYHRFQRATDPGHLDCQQCLYYGLPVTINYDCRTNLGGNGGRFAFALNQLGLLGTEAEEKPFFYKFYPESGGRYSYHIFMRAMRLKKRYPSYFPVYIFPHEPPAPRVLPFVPVIRPLFPFAPMPLPGAPVSTSGLLARSGALTRKPLLHSEENA